MPVTQTYTEEQIKLNYFLCPCLCFWTDPVWSYLTSSTTFLCWCSVGKGCRSKPPLKASPWRKNLDLFGDTFSLLTVSLLCSSPGWEGWGQAMSALLILYANTYKTHVTGNRCDVEHLGSAWGCPLAGERRPAHFKHKSRHGKSYLSLFF